MGVAASKGHVECVRYLMEVSEPKARDSWALRAALLNGHVGCARLLVMVSDVGYCRDRLSSFGDIAELAMLDTIWQEESLKAKYGSGGKVGRSSI